MKAITKLTQTQIDQFPAWVKQWITIGLSTDRANFDQAEHAVRDCYRVANLAVPKVILRMGSPFSATLGGIYAALIIGTKEVRSQVWSQVGSQVGSPWIQYRGCQLWAGWYSYVTFFRDVCGWKNPVLLAFSYDEALARSCGWTWWHELVCAISDRPHTISRNDRGQLHCVTGPAISYPDGWSIWCWNGVRVNESIVLRPGSLTKEEITGEANAQVRQVMVERIGIERVCQLFDATVLHQQGHYQLLNLDLGDGRRRPYLKMLNPSVGVWHVEGVHPNCKTVQQAINWRAGNENQEWQPEVLT